MSLADPREAGLIESVRASGAATKAESAAFVAYWKAGGREEAYRRDRERPAPKCGRCYNTRRILYFGRAGMGGKWGPCWCRPELRHAFLDTTALVLNHRSMAEV